MTAAELASLRDRVSRAQLAHEQVAPSLREEAGRRALAALHEAERRYRAKTGEPPKPPRLSLHCVYCGEPVRLRDQSKRTPVPPATCRLHRDLPGMDTHYGGGLS